MHGILPAQRTGAHTPGSDHPFPGGNCRSAQPHPEAPAGVFPPEPRQDSSGLGHRPESSPCCGGGAARPAVGRNAEGIPGGAAGRIWRGAQFLLKTAELGLICVYKVYLSPALPLACRYDPSCSQYAYEAIAKYGAWCGTGLALRRLWRCRPGGKFGYDPVP
jgi:uncharacterized protein